MALSRLGHLFAIPCQSSYNRRLKALAPRMIAALDLVSALRGRDNLLFVDSTPVECGRSVETVKRSDFAGSDAYGYSASHSRYFWGYRLHLICDWRGFPVGYELAPANADERLLALEIAGRVDLSGSVIVGDKGYAGAEFKQAMAALGAVILRPDKKNEPKILGSLGPWRQRIESVFETMKDQLSLEDHGAVSVEGLVARVAQRLLALGFVIYHNESQGIAETRSMIAYDH